MFRFGFFLQSFRRKWIAYRRVRLGINELFPLSENLYLIHLLSVAAPLGESGLPSGRLAQVDVAVPAHDDGLGVGEDGRNLEAPRALDVHEEAVRTLDEPLELVGAYFILWRRVQKVGRHCCYRCFSRE